MPLSTEHVCRESRPWTVVSEGYWLLLFSFFISLLQFYSTSLYPALDMIMWYTKIQMFKARATVFVLWSRIKRSRLKRRDGCRATVSADRRKSNGGTTGTGVDVESRSRDEKLPTPLIDLKWFLFVWRWMLELKIFSSHVISARGESSHTVKGPYQCLCMF